MADDSSNMETKEVLKPESIHPTGSTDTIDQHQKITSDVFAQGGLTRFYVPIDKYEGRHRYDPTAEWTEAEEKTLIRKVRRQ